MLCVFFFKQKTAYEMRISDWSSDVCSSDLPVPHDLPCCAPACRAAAVPDRGLHVRAVGARPCQYPLTRHSVAPSHLSGRPGSRVLLALSHAAQLQDSSHGVVMSTPALDLPRDRELGRASCRARVCQYV